jgi:hypothetical protein
MVPPKNNENLNPALVGGYHDFIKFSIKFYAVLRDNKIKNHIMIDFAPRPLHLGKDWALVKIEPTALLSGAAKRRRLIPSGRLAEAMPYCRPVDRG